MKLINSVVIQSAILCPISRLGLRTGLPFYDLTAIPELKELPRIEDSHSPPIFVPDGLIYGDEIVTRIYVSAFNPSYFQGEHY